MSSCKVSSLAFLTLASEREMFLFLKVTYSTCMHHLLWVSALLPTNIPNPLQPKKTPSSTSSKVTNTHEGQIAQLS